MDVEPLPGNVVEIIVEEGKDRRILENYLLHRTRLSVKAVRRLKRQGTVLLNGVKTYLNVEVFGGDVITIIYPAENPSPYLFPQKLALNILYEDQDLVLISKQPGICVHPTKGYPDGTLANGLLYHWEEKDEKAHVHFVNRLDRNTSGLVLVAKNSFSAQQLFLQQEKKLLQRSYLGLVKGHFPWERGIIELPIARVEGRTIQRQVAKEGQEAVTRYKVREYYLEKEKRQEFTLLELTLETGRTHQIRVHLSYLGYPLIGDSLYGTEEFLARQFLHAYKISYIHPRTKENIELEEGLPADLAGFLSVIK